MTTEILEDIMESLPSVERCSVSPHVLQTVTDYLFVREKMLNAGAPVFTDFGADLVLSLISESYSNEVPKSIQLMNTQEEPSSA